MSESKFKTTLLLIAGFNRIVQQMSADINRIIFKLYYLGVIIDSSILNENEEQLFETLLQEKNIYIGHRFNLLYRATRDGFTANDFHRRVDNKGATITLIKTKKDNVFAGFTKLPWTRNISFGKDESAFLMTIRSSNIYIKYHSKRPKLFQINKDKSEYAVFHHPDHLCSFGSDITMSCNYDRKEFKMGCYAFPKATSYYLNNGESTFIPVQIETYSCNVKKSSNTVHFI
eukprot:511289_1